SSAWERGDHVVPPRAGRDGDHFPCSEFFCPWCSGSCDGRPGPTSLDLHVRSRGSATPRAIPDPPPPPVAPGRWNTLEHFGTRGTLFPGRPAKASRDRRDVSENAPMMAAACSEVDPPQKR